MILAIYGTGGAGCNALNDALLMEKYENIIFINDYLNIKSFKNCELYTFDDFIKKYHPNQCEIYIAMGDPANREKIYLKCKKNKYHLATIIHPSVKIGENVIIGEGCHIRPFVDIQNNVKIGNNSLIEVSSIICENVVVGTDCMIASKCIILSNATLKNKVFIGMKSIINSNLIIDMGAIIAMGSVVLKNIEKNSLYSGNPCRKYGNAVNYKVFH